MFAGIIVRVAYMRQLVSRPQLHASQRIIMFLKFCKLDITFVCREIVSVVGVAEGGE